MHEYGFQALNFSLRMRPSCASRGLGPSPCGQDFGIRDDLTAWLGLLGAEVALLGHNLLCTDAQTGYWVCLLRMPLFQPQVQVTFQSILWCNSQKVLSGRGS